jgi:hypothetical protein
MRSLVCLVVLTVSCAWAGSSRAQPPTPPPGPLGSIGQVTIIDLTSGERLTPHWHEGEYWVAGRPKARYAIEVRNALGERLLAVTSVDGLNIIGFLARKPRLCKAGRKRAFALRLPV